MIEEKLANAQLQRMISLNFFPSEKTAQKELAKALQRAASPAIAIAVVDEWLSLNSDRPTPADLSRLVGDMNGRASEQKAKCSPCGGSGFITWWFLVTYKGRSFTIEDHERLQDITTNEQACEYTERLRRFMELNPNAKRQAVISAAKPCVCRDFNRRIA